MPIQLSEEIRLRLPSAHTFTIKTIQNQIRFRNDDKLDQFGSVSPLKTVPNPKGSNVAMTSLHINVIKGALEGEIPTNSDFDMTIFKKKSLPQGPFLGYCFHFTCALLGMKWWCWHFVLNRCIGCIWLQAWAFPLWKIRLCFKPPHSETLLIHFSRYSCWCKQNRWSLNHKDMALRRKGGVTHGRQPAPLDIKFEISCSNGGCVGTSRVSIEKTSTLCSILDTESEFAQEELLDVDLLDYIVNYIVLISRNQFRQGSRSGVFFPRTENHAVGD